LFDGLVVPLLRAFFYATESSTHKNRVFYYRKPLWKDMQGEALVALRDAM
jgi:telomerase reverse transcriptase